MTIPSVPIELELVLVRHGQTQWNAEHRYLGHTDLPLLPSAAPQLSQLKQQLGRLTKEWRDAAQGTEQFGVKTEVSDAFWRVYCSDLLRCRETLAYIIPTSVETAVYDQRLREMNFGDWEGCSYDQLKDNPLYRSWIDNPSIVTPPEGEAWAQFHKRLHSFLSDLGQAAEDMFKENMGETVSNRVLIVTHGGVIRHILAQVCPEFTFYSAIAPSPGTARVLRIFWQNDAWSVKSLRG